MSLYAGETVLIKHTATMDTVPLTNVDIATCTITIYDSTLQVVRSTVPMTWNNTKDRWEYAWASPGPTGGSYRVKIRMVGLDGADNWEYKTIRLKTKVV